VRMVVGVIVVAGVAVAVIEDCAHVQGSL